MTVKKIRSKDSEWKKAKNESFFYIFTGAQKTVPGHEILLILIKAPCYEGGHFSIICFSVFELKLNLRTKNLTKVRSLIEFGGDN